MSIHVSPQPPRELKRFEIIVDNISSEYKQKNVSSALELGNIDLECKLRLPLIITTELGVCGLNDFIRPKSSAQ